MRHPVFSTFPLAFGLAATIAGVVPVQAQVPVTLVPVNGLWRYNAGGTNLPTAADSWTATDYNDSWWPSGPALLGYDTTPEVYPLPILTPILAPVNGGPNTAYFRARFNFPSNSTTGVILVASNLLDDGAVFYLNGAEIQRIRMPAGVVNYGTYASAQPNEGVFEVFSLPATNVRRGDNVLAVEVHQVNPTTPDDVFGMSLTALFPEPIAITQPPLSQTVAEGNPVTFSVGVSGSDPRYQWFTNDHPAPGATQASYAISNPQLSPTGTRVCVVVTNALSAMTNCARLTVVPDIYPPALLSAVASDVSPGNTLTLTFTEPLLRDTATNPANYGLRLLGTSNTVTLSNTLYAGSAVRLRVGGSNWLWGGTFVLSVHDVADVKTNWIAPPSNQVLVTFPQVLVPIDGVSLYWDWLTADYFLSPPVPLAPDWKLPEYDDRDANLWLALRGIIYADWTPPATLCGPLGHTIDSAQTNITHYFRTHFNASHTRGPASLWLEHVTMHGAVFYLNGVEIYRHNLPPGPMTPQTAATECTAPACLTSTNIPVTNLRAGDNVLAVELHRCTDRYYTEVYYGVRVQGVIPPAMPEVAIRWAAPGRVRVDWTAPVPGIFELESARDLPGGEWTPAGTDSPVELNVNPGESRFFRVREQ